MTEPFSEAEVRYLIAWAREDHRGPATGPARTLQRHHGVHAAVMAQLIARLSTVTRRTQYDMLNGPAPEGPITWPWPTSQVFEARLKKLLPESTIHYLEQLGALPPRRLRVSHDDSPLRLCDFARQFLKSAI
jgi:hypothetical protein